MILDIAQIIIAILLIITILVQSRGSGLGAAFGGGDSSYRTKRGAEKVVYVTTIVLAIAFLVITFVNVVIV